MLYQNFDIQLELGDLYNVLALISIGTRKEDIDRLIKSLEIISKAHSSGIFNLKTRSMLLVE